MGLCKEMVWLMFCCISLVLHSRDQWALHRGSVRLGGTTNWSVFAFMIAWYALAKAMMTDLPSHSGPYRHVWFQLWLVFDDYVCMHTVGCIKRWRGRRSRSCKQHCAATYCTLCEEKINGKEVEILNQRTSTKHACQAKEVGHWCTFCYFSWKYNACH